MSVFSWIAGLFSTDSIYRPVNEFPRSEYGAYFETILGPRPGEWETRIMSRTSPGVLAASAGQESSDEKAKWAALKWARAQMKQHRIKS